MKRTMGVEPDDAPTARRSWSLLGVGGANSMQPLLPAGGDYWYTMQCFGDLLEDPMMDQALQPGILKNVRQEFDKHRPMLDVLDCHGRNSTTMKKDPAHVEYAAGVVYDWLSEEGGSVLGFLQVLSIGGLPYSDEFSDNVHRCASGIKAMTMTKVEYQSIMVAWLCFGGRVVPPLVDCAPTQIEADASSSDDGSCHSIATSDATSMAGPVTADDIHFACYRQLNGLAFGTLAVERQSRGAIHVHSMAWADPSDSVQ